MSRALVLGVTGQDGSYLIEQLSAAGHEVWGMTRRPGAAVGVPTVRGDLLDQASLERALASVAPDVVYNLAAVTSPGGGWGVPPPPLLADVTGLGVVRLLEAMVRVTPRARLVHASSSAVLDPQRYGLYGAAKVLAHEAVRGYRDRLWTTNAVLYSHTSPRQDPRFLAPRVFATIAAIAAGRADMLTLGDLTSRRDWGYAPDYCEALQLLATRDDPGDVIVAAGRTHSVRELVQAALDTAGLPWDPHVLTDPTAPATPAEVPARHAPLPMAQGLGWAPRHSFTDMVRACMTAAEGSPS